jgi:hypothetical protein
MNELDKFIQILHRKVGESKQAQLRFVVCKSVDWSGKTMAAVGVSDDVPYEGIQLGFGYVDVKPKNDTICLIGILEGKEALTFLINAEQVELVEVKADKITFNGGSNKEIVKIEQLQKNLDSLKKYCEALKLAVATGINAVGISSSASGTVGATAFNNAMTGESIAFEDMKDEKILH